MLRHILMPGLTWQTYSSPHGIGSLRTEPDFRADNDSKPLTKSWIWPGSHCFFFYFHMEKYTLETKPFHLDRGKCPWRRTNFKRGQTKAKSTSLLESTALCTVSPLIDCDSLDDSKRVQTNFHLNLLHKDRRLNTEQLYYKQQCVQTEVPSSLNWQ